MNLENRWNFFDYEKNNWIKTFVLFGCWPNIYRASKRFNLKKNKDPGQNMKKKNNY